MRQNEMHEVEPGTNLQMQIALLPSLGAATRMHSVYSPQAAACNYCNSRSGVVLTWVGCGVPAGSPMTEHVNRGAGHGASTQTSGMRSQLRSTGMMDGQSTHGILPNEVR